MPFSERRAPLSPLRVLRLTGGSRNCCTGVANPPSAVPAPPPPLDHTQPARRFVALGAYPLRDRRANLKIPLLCSSEADAICFIVVTSVTPRRIVSRRAGLLDQLRAPCATTTIRQLKLQFLFAAPRCGW
ncbi:hypothetical protein KCP73_16545 [Salmonella enterica subsp. enterica]|nr:hypothetical protein KCP73_16545 [Salmonella enterica subsp. enterica]